MFAQSVMETRKRRIAQSFSNVATHMATHFQSSSIFNETQHVQFIFMATGQTKMLPFSVHTPKCGIFPVSTHPQYETTRLRDIRVADFQCCMETLICVITIPCTFWPTLASDLGFLVLNRQSDKFTRIKQDDVDLLDWFPTKQFACLHQLLLQYNS